MKNEACIIFFGVNEAHLEQKRLTIGRQSMFTNFKDLEAYVLAQNTKKRIALANAHDEPALSAVVNAKRKGVVEGTLIGKEPEIIEMLHEMGENEADYEIIHFDGEELEAAKIADEAIAKER